MTADFRRLPGLLFDRLGGAALNFAYPVVKRHSRILAAHLALVRKRGGAADGKASGSLRIPHYWAEFLHDGRGPVQAAPGRVLVYWRKEWVESDPRLFGGIHTAQTRSQERRLTYELYVRGLEENLRLARAGVPLDQLPMVVTRSSGPSEGKFFFTEGMEPFRDEAERLTMQAMDEFAMELVEEYGGSYRTRFGISVE